jgi:predicted DNA-binding protein
MKKLKPHKSLITRAAKASISMVKDPERAAVTLSLKSRNYEQLKTLCKNNGWIVSRVVDEVIEAFLQEARKESLL